MNSLLGMKTAKLLSINTFLLAALFFAAFAMSACGSDDSVSVPQPQEAVIEETDGGLEVLEQEFGECDEEPGDLNEPNYVQNRPSIYSKQKETEAQFPHSFSSLEQMFPLRGSWRQSKEEIMDLVDRHVWDPKDARVYKMLQYFDMVLLVNVADRTNATPESYSAQRMQVLVRDGSSNDLRDWKRLHVWPISSGKPCGKRIGTFTGVFKIDPARVYSSYKSQLFDDADMYETMFLYHKYRDGRPTGVAIHGSYKSSHLGRKDSGGCIRLHRNNSKCLFDTITGSATEQCLDGGKINYAGSVISLESKNGEADPDHFSSRSGFTVTTGGYRVMVAIFNQENDEL